MKFLICKLIGHKHITVEIVTPAFSHISGAQINIINNHVSCDRCKRFISFD